MRFLTLAGVVNVDDGDGFNDPDDAEAKDRNDNGVYGEAGERL